MAKWNESEHPRDDDGKFTDGTGGGRTQWITSKRDFSNVQAGEKDLQENGKSSNIKLSKQEFEKARTTQVSAAPHGTAQKPIHKSHFFPLHLFPEAQ